MHRDELVDEGLEGKDGEALLTAWGVLGLGAVGSKTDLVGLWRWLHNLVGTLQTTDLYVLLRFN